MTKQEEIEILTATAAALGPTTYTGNWIRSQLPIMVAAIRADMDPATYGALDLNEYRKLAGEIVDRAKDEAKRITAAAEQKAEQASRIGKETMDRFHRVKNEIDNARHEFEQAIKRAYNQ